MLTQEELKKELRYDKETGEFYWILPKQGRRITKEVGSTDKHLGYRWIMVNGEKHYAHRLAWLYEYGEFPTQEIDHIDRDRLNNRIANLRDVSHQVNIDNRGGKTHE